jgi:N-acetylmuramoyl-L-alanine amidase
MKFYLRGQFIYVLPAFATTSARCKLPFGGKINISDVVHCAKVWKTFFVLTPAPLSTSGEGNSPVFSPSQFDREGLGVSSIQKALLSSFFLFSFLFPGIGQTQQECYSKKLNAYFSKDHKLNEYVSINKEGISIFSGEQHKREIFLDWNEINFLSPLISNISSQELKKLLIDEKDSLEYYVRKDSIKERNIPHSLKGMKIAIDPGHIGGSYHMGEAESRCMTLALDITKKISLVEGNLTFFTALLLKQKLDSMGADVMLTRTDTGLSSLGITFYEWKKKIKNKIYVDSLINNNLISEKGVELLKRHLPDKVLFSEVFGSVDMAERAKMINAFQPDITVIIHYNVNEKNLGWKHTTDKDYVMAFVPGCVTSKDLETLAGRLNFLRLLISPDIENSVKVSSAVVNNISTKLNVPLAQDADAAYLTEHCLSTPEKGVYSRDLALTRMIKGPLVYGEPLYQDNDKECVLLTEQNSERIKLVAEAYYKGIVEYIK